MDKLKLITEMSNKEARAFLLKSQSYCSIDLPGYFNFDCILEEINNKFEKINENNVKNYVKMNNLKEQDDINCKIYANKDGNFDWRPLEIINPYLYIYLVRYLTRTDVWYQLVNCFNNNKVERITVASIPVESQISTKDKKEQIYNWWDEVEQESIVYALDYKKIIHLDISNCYGSIYTHVISWAIHGKNHAKNQKRNKNLLGNKIDYLIQLMQNNQTNGIPQGSILMDFVAEIILTYADKLLENKIGDYDIDYKIIRYRDDYRIFANDSETINIVTKALNVVLMTLNFKLNSKKTVYSEDIIISSIKEDKISYQDIISSIYTKISPNELVFHLNLPKHLLKILMFSKRYPNSGSVMKMLNEFHVYRLDDIKLNEHTYNIQCISILTEIMMTNLKTTPLCIAIISSFINSFDICEKQKIIEKIIKKVSSTPNVDLVNIWLQRLTIKELNSLKYDTNLCEFVCGNREKIFNISWIKGIKNQVELKNIIDTDYIENMENIISPEETSLFLF
ncbi:RNA-directed DNA polymerase, partial [Staphylococcus argenteus]|uniref:RNA-directed DNA polymerase n=1 Tax=Staphylococcus argenteus TaxID=985002 RepID=UPI00178CCFC5